MIRGVMYFGGEALVCEGGGCFLPIGGESEGLARRGLGINSSGELEGGGGLGGGDRCLLGIGLAGNI